MNKALEALEILKEANTIYCGCASNLFARYRFEIETIETALKDYQEIIDTGWKNIPSNLKMLSNIFDKYLPNSDTLKDLEKLLKALEIIKSKKKSVGKMYINTHEQRVSKYISIYDIADEEFDLLKEVLK